MKILILNWRDIKNPKSGGAEVLTHEMAKRWVSWGNQVTQVSEAFFQGKREEDVDGVRIVRLKKVKIFFVNFPIHISIIAWYFLKGKNKYDVVVDEVHGVPFFTPFYVKEKKVVLICEVAKEIWDVIFRFPVNHIGHFIENNYFRFYKKVKFLTISLSTKTDLVAMGIEGKNITILPMGITRPHKIVDFPKEKPKTVLFVGRLTKTKGIEDAIRAAGKVYKDTEKINVWIIGRGEEKYEQYLKDLSRKEGIDISVKFWGYVSSEKKFELMSRAYVLVVPSVKEGWGLIVPEAGLCKTPAVVYDVPGLKDIVSHKKNGFIVDNNVEALADGVRALLTDTDLYLKLQKGALHMALQQDWDKTAKTALMIMEQ